MGFASSLAKQVPPDVELYYSPNTYFLYTKEPVNQNLKLSQTATMNIPVKTRTPPC